MAGTRTTTIALVVASLLAPLALGMTTDNERSRSDVAEAPDVMIDGPDRNATDRILAPSEPPAGLGTLDPWIDAQGDEMFGDLVLGFNAISFDGGELRSGSIESLTFAGREVCVEDGPACGFVRRVETGAGLTGGPISDAGTISVADGGIVASMIGEPCADGEALKSAAGSWGCAADEDTTYTAGLGLALGGTSFSADTAYVQRRVTTACGALAAMSAIAADGSAVCSSVINTGWGFAGNSGTTAGTNFVGTTDNVAFELKVNGQRALRLEPGANPNVIGGDASNTVTAGVQGATIGGGGELFLGNAGSANRVTDSYGTVGGGGLNRAGDTAGTTTDRRFATVGGGRGNTASGSESTVGGGASNIASGTASTVGGGSSNTAAISHSTVGGGILNAATNDRSTVGGGAFNTASGIESTVPGGFSNRADGTSSFAAGQRASAWHDGAFVWADSRPFDFASTAANQFNVRATGGTRIVSAIDAAGAVTTGVELPAGAGAWSALSDRASKRDIEPLDTVSVLHRLMGIPISTWSWITQDDVRHMGPMAQDFAAAFDLGESDARISTVDADGVALAAIQGLYQLVQEQDARIAELEAMVAELAEDRSQP